MGSARPARLKPGLRRLGPAPCNTCASCTVSPLAQKTLRLEIAMLYYMWLYGFLAPIVALDMLLRTSPLYYAGAWPLGFDYLANDY